MSQVLDQLQISRARLFVGEGRQEPGAVRDPLLGPAPRLRRIGFFGLLEVDVVFVELAGGDAVADTAGCIPLVEVVARVAVPVALHHARIERIEAEDCLLYTSDAADDLLC